MLPSSVLYAQKPDPVEISAAIQHVRGDLYRLVVRAAVPHGQYIYSIDQEAGGPIPTVIKVVPTTKIVQKTNWREIPKPVIRQYDFWPGLDVLIQTGKVRWLAEFNSSEPVFQIAGEVTLYPCAGSVCYSPQTLRFIAINK
jgi:hypothetical protein